MSINKLPIDPLECEAFKRIDTYVKPNNKTETQKFYSSWAYTYDADYEKIEYKPHIRMASTLTKLIFAEDKRSKDFFILDVASGTGNCVVTLRKHGFGCTFDGIEGNELMNAEAQKKSLYRNLTVHFISSENRIPVDDATYDVIISIGGFSRSHIQADCIKDVVRLLKPGGIFWFSVRKSSGAEKYNEAVDEAIAELVRQKVCQTVIREEFDYYTYDSDEKVIIRGYERCLRKSYV